jgi:hypothetical protein
MAISAGPFVVGEGSGGGGIPVYTYFYPDNVTMADSYRKAAEEYLDLYVSLFGPYPFEKFAVVENFFPTGYGFPSWTLLGSTVLRLPFIIETSLGHEIAHSWWGNGVWVNYSKGNWSEGLTTYVADHLYRERTSAAEGQEYREKILRDYATLVTPGKDFPLAAFTSRSTAADQAIGYGKAAMVFHMTRHLIGDEAFWGGLREIAGDKLFKEITWDDFARILGQKAGRDLSKFMRQWVARPGAPTLRLINISVQKLENSWRITGELEQSAPYFDLQVPILLETEGRPLQTTLTSRSARTPFIFDSKALPVRLVADPGTDLFRRLEPQEIPPSVNSLRASAKLITVVASGTPDDRLPALQTLLQSMRQEQTPVYAEEDISTDALKGHDVLFLGWPVNPTLRPPLPDGLVVENGGFSFAGKWYANGDAVLFAALPHPSDPLRTTAVFVTQSAVSSSCSPAMCRASASASWSTPTQPRLITTPP